MTMAAKQDLDDIPSGWIRWRPVGQVSRDQDGDLVLPPVAAVPGIYRFMIDDGAGMAAGYIGQIAPISCGWRWLPTWRGSSAPPASTPELDPHWHLSRFLIARMNAPAPFRPRNPAAAQRYRRGEWSPALRPGSIPLFTVGLRVPG